MINTDTAPSTPKKTQDVNQSHHRYFPSIFPRRESQLRAQRQVFFYWAVGLSLFCDVCYDPSHLAPKFPLLGKNSLPQLSKIRSHNMRTLTGESPLTNRGQPNSRIKRWRGQKRASSSSNWNPLVSQAEENTAHAQQN